ncbi:hypothetical protein L6452_23577, partial [Arctium lappa]
GRLGTGGDSGGVVRVIVAGIVVADSREEQSGGVREFADKWTLDTCSHRHLFRPRYNLPYRHWCSYLHRCVVWFYRFVHM